jgi:flagellar protein FliO/FliZ
MKIRCYFLAFSGLVGANFAYASDSVSSSISMLKIVLGLCTVLAVIVLGAWILRRMLPSLSGQQSIAKVLTSISVGSREKVVVIELAGRWIVLGVAPGQVSAIANIKAVAIPSVGLGNNQKVDDFIFSSVEQANKTSFAQRLRDASRLWQVGAKVDEINNANI